MTERKIEILWTKVGDGTQHQRKRKRTLSVRLPVELHVETLGATNMTPELLDAVLSLPPDPRSCGVYRVRLAAPRTSLTDDDVLEMALPQLRREIEAAAQEKVEQEEAERAALFVRLTMFAKGDPAVDPKEFTPGGFRKVLSEAASKAMDGCDELRAHVNARLELLSEIVEKKEAEEAARVRAAQEERDRKKEEAAAACTAEIKAWAAEHGSARLNEQLTQGLDGWPLYLHERLQAEFGDDAELDNDGEHGDPLVNPNKAQLGVARQVAILVVERGLAESKEKAFRQIEIVPIKVITEEDRDEEGYGYDPDDPSFTKVYVTFSGYRPGSEAFAAKTIRFVCEE